MGVYISTFWRYVSCCRDIFWRYILQCARYIPVLEIYIPIISPFWRYIRDISPKLKYICNCISISASELHFHEFRWEIFLFNFRRFVKVPNKSLWCTTEQVFIKIDFRQIFRKSRVFLILFSSLNFDF